MAKSEYQVPIVRKEWLRLWRDHADGKVLPEEASELVRKGELTKHAYVKAKNILEAVRMAEAEHPGCVAIAESVNRLG